MAFLQEHPHQYRGFDFVLIDFFYILMGKHLYRVSPADDANRPPIPVTRISGFAQRGTEPLATSAWGRPSSSTAEVPKVG